MKMKIKICGITNTRDALCVLKQGADFFGLVFYPKSPRNMSLEQAKEIIDFLKKEGFASPPAIGVFVDEETSLVTHYAKTLELFAVQLHGKETPEYCQKIPARIIKAFRIKNPEDMGAIGQFDSWAYLCDAYDPHLHGGTGKRIDASLVSPYITEHRIFLAGGLTPKNISHALSLVRPFAVDVSSGVEISPGIKDPGKIEAFIQAVRKLE